MQVKIENKNIDQILCIESFKTKTILFSTLSMTDDLIWCGFLWRKQVWRNGVGLSEIFHHQPNLSLVFKHFKATLLALQHSAKSMDL